MRNNLSPYNSLIIDMFSFLQFWHFKCAKIQNKPPLRVAFIILWHSKQTIKVNKKPLAKYKWKQHEADKGSRLVKRSREEDVNAKFIVFDRKLPSSTGVAINLHIHDLLNDFYCGLLCFWSLHCPIKLSLNRSNEKAASRQSLFDFFAVFCKIVLTRFSSRQIL